MGYFDALTSGAFKTTPEGRRLFFPWGAMGRGYEIGPEQDYETLRRRIKLWTIVGLVLILAALPTAGISCRLHRSGSDDRVLLRLDAVCVAQPATVGRKAHRPGEHDHPGACPRSPRAAVDISLIVSIAFVLASAIHSHRHP